MNKNRDEILSILKKDLNDLKYQNEKIINDINYIEELLKKESKIDNEHICPICGYKSEFLPLNAQYPNEIVRCPKCKSLHRHRLIFLLFAKKFKHLLDNPIKLLHFAPEPCLYNFFREKENIDYYPVDINPEGYKSRNIFIRCKVNMENIPYEDNNFDVIYNSHVLEHVPKDIQAMAELRRVLKPNGVCFIMVPMSGNQETLEKEEYNTPELRLKYYNQEDHLRFYGKDFRNRLASVGFNVQELRAEDIVNSEEMELYGISQWDKVFICKK